MRGCEIFGRPPCYDGMFLYDLINKDVKFEDETRKVMVALRVMYLAVLASLISNTFILGTQAMYDQRIKLLFLVAANIVLFIQTYCFRTKIVLWSYIVFSFVWIFMMIPIEGWKAGVQNFFMPMLMLVFFGSYAKKLQKFIVAALVLIVMISFIILMSDAYVSLYSDPARDKALQIVNVTAVFCCVVYISYNFSKAEKESEGKLIKYNDTLKEAANTDQLTGLFNRRRAEQYMEEQIEASNGNPISISIGDIDFFKKVNDTHGHDAGDEVLKHIANVMKDTLRSDSFIARWGGEEFLIVLPNCNGDQAYMALDRLRRRIMGSSVLVGDAEISVTMTFGVSEYDFSGSMDASIKEADERLYRGKENGRNQVVY